MTGVKRDAAVGAVVLGMSRSGTSLVSGSLVAAGFSLGRDDDLMEANDGNPAGYWENKVVRRFNDELLDLLGGSWFTPPSREAQRSSASWATLRVRSLFGSLRAQAGDRPLVIKDPRIGLILDLWGAVTGDLLHPVLVVRNPIEVALSLASRDGIPIALALASWSAHTARLLEYLQGRLVTVVRYDDLLVGPAAPSAFVGKVAAHLDPRLAEVVDPSVGPAPLEAGLRHYDASSLDAAEELTGDQLRLWRYLEHLEPEDQVLEVPATLSPALEPGAPLTGMESDWRRAAEDQLRYVDRCERAAAEAHRLRGQLDELAAKADQDELRIRVMSNSFSWRVTTPLRALWRYSGR